MQLKCVNKELHFSLWIYKQVHYVTQSVAYLSAEKMFWHLSFFFFGLARMHKELPRPGIELMCPALEVPSVNHWTTMEVWEDDWNQTKILVYKS